MLKHKKNRNCKITFLGCRIVVLLMLAFSVLSSCDSSKRSEKEPLFVALEPDHTHIDFQNTLTSTNDFNIYKYRNFYNGGGVGLGDINNDGLLDIYLTGNMVPNKLYLNKGDFAFEDITDQAQIAGKGAWSTGVSMVDINGDGWLDIYICNSGDVKGDDKQNEFFINNGDGTFSEKAEELGLADQGFSTHAAFFDYDKDGDLDVYLLNNSYQSIGSFNLKKNERPIRDKLGGDKLLRNDGGRFIDVSEQAGIYGSVIGFGLGVSVSDLDKDGWMDLYISNDFFERDYIYMNNGDGTFREELEKQMRSISVASMGSDIADITADGYPDVFVTEMLPEGDERFKTTMTFEDWDKYQYNLENGYYHQFTRNMLHINNGLIPDRGVTFTEVGRLAGVEATDWSWGSLIADLDNDGFKDIYITNGIAQDILNQDYLNYTANEEFVRTVVSKEGVDFKKLIDIIPTNRIPNYAYSGSSSLYFTDVTKEWGLDTPSHSNGAAYGDLDNDGDLDLVVNNVNMPLFVYQNQTDSSNRNNNYLKVVLEGVGGNTAAIGTKVTLKIGDKTFYQEQSLNRGFQSSVDNRLNFGLGSSKKIDSLIVDWFSGRQTVLTDIDTNQAVVLRENEAVTGHNRGKKNTATVNRIFSEISQLQGVGYTHKENVYSDFDRDRLLYHMKSTEGPKMSISDVNGDGVQDFYIGGAKDSPGALFIQSKEGKFKGTNETLFEKDKGSEDLQCLFFDADADGDQDLYVTSGGNEFSSGAFALVDRLYINDSFGNFTKSGQLLPGGIPESSSTVISSDIDGDGDLDLFVGIRIKSGEVGVPQNGYILKNDGDGNFTNNTETIAPVLKDLGMITDAVWSDYDSDGDDDLIIVGEWMAIRVFNNTDGIFKEATSQVGLSDTRGWWNRIEASDLDGDGDMDYVVGNHGLNSRFRASLEKPLTRYINDFDQNGSVEQIISSYNGDKSYPLVLRHDLVMQLPNLKKKYLKYESYKGQTIEDIFTEEELKATLIEKVTMLENVVLWNMGNGMFEIKELPGEAQLSPVYAVLIEDIDNDGIKDIVLGGNLNNVKPEVGRYDASYGTVLKGLGKGNFKVVPMTESGLFLKGEIRDFQLIEIAGQNTLLVARNNAPMQVFKF